ncbi:MAG: type II CAAX endopeptidase family protein [Anaerolineae bacterium]|jgi:membrane protease YdiL (CAAX protease family)
MNDMEKLTPSLGSAAVKVWQRIPLLIRAIVVGLLVFAIAGSAARIVILALVPAPWSIVVMGGVLWLYWKYFSGSWWPKSTAHIRRHRFRATTLSRSVWGWSLLAAILGVVVLEAGFVITFRIIEFPAEAWTVGHAFDTLPVWQAWSFVIMAALVAGITEEVGFRGYMQVPLEERYGPVLGIAIVSIVFVVLHLNQAWAPPVLLHLFAMSVLWGILATTSGSLIPGIVSHAVADVINFSYWWTDLAGSFDRQPIAETGVDAHFIAWALICMASLALFFWAARKTLVARQARGGQRNESTLRTSE